ncbi:acetyl-CoA synthetase-like protein [Phanerochaete sordida]|uniref:Acetyl-CoA synthetase-like protein n=1 Tax=Phanerochaete sordida TaxID=48140 RepID=A0A9P3LD10_9APHY|nr:acetyl-CoA synthetase-like protein [Phanerochaete sordida]
MSSGQRESLCLPALPRTQALTSTTFTPPPLDGSLSVPEAYDWHYEHSPHHPLFIYSDDEGSATTIYWPDASMAVHRAGRVALSIARERPSPLGTGRPIFAILAGNESITYFTLMTGICRAGFIAFPISPRNSPEAVAHLLAETGVSYIFVGVEDALQRLWAAAAEALRADGATPPWMHAVPAFRTLYPAERDPHFKLLPVPDARWDDVTIILHSSGSTAFPKPIRWTHERYLLGCLAPWFGERDLTGQRLAFHSMPMFHGLGMMQIGWTAFSGLVLTVFGPHIPPVVPTSESVIRGAIATKSDFIFCVPSFIEEWARNPEHVRHLRSVQGIIYGGGPLSQTVGDDLVRQGVSIFQMYGISETGINNVSLPKVAEKDWQYFAIARNIKAHFEPDGDGHYEFVSVSSTFQKPCVENTEVDGVPAYATNDLLMPHPTKPGFWRIYGRKDDQIMHSTGEKTNPGPIEKILCTDHHVQAAVMFGRGRFNAGVLVDPVSQYKFDPADERKLVEFRNLIWPTVEAANKTAPQHSRIFKEMIIVSSPSKPFTYTAKNAPRRQAILNDYEPEIEALYNVVEKGTQDGTSPPQTWDLAGTTQFVRGVVTKVLNTHVGDDEDIFRKGCDSLQATWIRNSLLHSIRIHANVGTRNVSSNLVYEHPTVRALTSVLMRLVHPTSTPDAPAASKTTEMLRLVEKYSFNFPAHMPDRSRAKSHEGDVVLVTGTTGGFGSELLAQLATSPTVALVYALNRRCDIPAAERQQAAFEERELDTALLKSKKIVLLECDTHEDRLGLPDDIYEQICNSVTHIIHNAWTVNFNLALSFFEPNIKTLRNLMDLALSSPHDTPPKLLFESTVGVLAHRSIDIREASIAPEHIAHSAGYSESKWIGEQLCKVASERTPLHSICVRVGQLCGSASGAWNACEWLPSLIRSSVFLKCLPEWDLDISMLPADDAARALLEILRSTDPAPFLHLVHPRATAWATLLAPVAEEYSLQFVPFAQWVALLEASGRALDGTSDGRDTEEVLRANPALKLLQFFKTVHTNDHTASALGVRGLETVSAQRASAALRTLPALDGAHTRRWLAYWRRHGFLP